MTEDELFEKCNNDIKPCPFCGGKAVFTSRSYGSGNYGSGWRLVIDCNNCGLTMDGPDISWQDVDQYKLKARNFVDKWNRRSL